MELIYYLIFLDRDKMNVYRDKLAKVTALSLGELATEDTCGVFTQQRLTMILHRENSRACLRRF